MEENNGREKLLLVFNIIVHPHGIFAWRRLVPYVMVNISAVFTRSVGSFLLENCAYDFRLINKFWQAAESS